ncbi:MAG: hypothetical protein JWN13_3314 [Betaproteobacteria bacterium]|jgi:hypothetical protein|nr:hypothetical protein [Betaproteobacteria bacterium]
MRISNREKSLASPVVRPVVGKAPEVIDLQIPSFIRSLNRHAERHGLATSVRIAHLPAEWKCSECEWARGDVVLSTWSGTIKQLLATGFVRESYRFPTGGIGWFP